MFDTCFFFCKQRTAYEVRISDWSSDVCSSDLVSDAPIFKAAREKIEKEADAGYGLVEVFKRYPRGVFTAMGLRFGENILYYMVVAFPFTYLHHREVNTTRILTDRTSVASGKSVSVRTDLCGRRIQKKNK